MGSNQSISGPPCKWFFQITFSVLKIIKKIGRFLDFLRFYPTICALIRPVLKKNNFRTSKISWKITKILKTLSENKHQVILYLYPYLFSQYSVTLFTFCAVPIVKTIHNFITLGNCSCKGWRLSTIMVIKYMDRRNKSAFEAEKHNWTARMTRFTQ